MKKSASTLGFIFLTATAHTLLSAKIVARLVEERIVSLKEISVSTVAMRKSQKSASMSGSTLQITTVHIQSVA